MRSEKENEKKRKRYAEDPEYRNKIIAAARTYRAENKDEIKVRREEKGGQIRKPARRSVGGLRSETCAFDTRSPV